MHLFVFCEIPRSTERTATTVYANS